MLLGPSLACSVLVQIAPEAFLYISMVDRACKCVVTGHKFSSLRGPAVDCELYEAHVWLEPPWRQFEERREKGDRCDVSSPCIITSLSGWVMHTARWQTDIPWRYRCTATSFLAVSSVHCHCRGQRYRGKDTPPPQDFGGVGIFRQQCII